MIAHLCSSVNGWREDESRLNKTGGGDGSDIAGGGSGDETG